MIKFFRRIRRNLLPDNSFNKYLLYAIGEIVLVVIGILIALQINNWNIDRIQRKFETDILKEILVNLQQDVINLNSKIDFNNDKININVAVVTHLKQKSPLSDTLKDQYFNLIGRGAFQPITVAYENLKSKGIDLIRNDSLRIAISELYDFKYFYLTEDLMEDYLPIRNAHENEVYKNVRSTWTGLGFVAEPADLTELQNNTYFHEIITRAIAFYFWMNQNYTRGISENEEVQQMIKDELGLE
jgi:hypothetical protein